MIHIPAKDRELILSLIEEHLGPVKTWAFGSRVRGDHHRYSDLDLAFQKDGGAFSSKALAGLELAFKESDLLYSVDCVDLTAVDTDFTKLILRTGEELKSA